MLGGPFHFKMWNISRMKKHQSKKGQGTIEIRYNYLHALNKTATKPTSLKLPFLLNDPSFLTWVAPQLLKWCNKANIDTNTLQPPIKIINKLFDSLKMLMMMQAALPIVNNSTYLSWPKSRNEPCSEVGSQDSTEPNSRTRTKKFKILTEIGCSAVMFSF